MKFLKYILFLFIVFITPNVFAYDYDVTSSITAPSGPTTGGRYLGLEIYNSGLQNNYSVNTRYNGTLSEIVYNLPLPSNAGQCFTTNMDYTITMEMATSDWRNHFTTPFVSWYSGGTNWKSSNVVFVSMKKIYFKFKIPSTETTCYDFVYVRLRSSSVSSTAFTGETNWNLSKITLTDGYSSSGGSGGGSGGGSNIDPNQSVIDNNNENTENIINNNNQNTQDIINNQNELLGDKCSNLLDFPYTSSNPYSITATSNDYYVVTSFTINLDANVNYYYSYKSNKDYSSNTTSGVEFFLLKDGQTSTLIHPSGKSGTFTPSVSGTYAIRLDCNKNGDTCTFYDFMISKNTSSYCKYGSYSSKLDEANTGINNINDSLTNSNIDNSVGSDFFNNFSSQDFGLSQIITLPLTTIQSLANTSCVSLNIPIPFTNSTIPLPCMTQVYQTYIPTIFVIWQVVSFGIIAYFICIDIVHLVKGFKDPDSDKVEVLDL